MTANIANIVFPGVFNPKTDKWRDYKEQLMCALDAAGVGQDNLNKGRSLFLSQCGRDTYALIASLLVPKRPVDVDLIEIFNILDKFYHPEVNEILEAGKFHKRQQEHGESLQDFVAAINSLSAKCNFSDLKRQLRDRLVLGVRDDRLRRDLLKTKEKSKDLTYEVALQMCLNYQVLYPDMYTTAMASDSKQVSSDSTSVEPMDIGNIKSNECRRCSRVHRESERCQFTKAKCYYCKRFGHIAAACHKKRSRLHQVQDLSEECTNTTGPDKMMGIFAFGGSSPAPITAEVTIEGVNVVMEIDSGASRTIMAEETFTKLWKTPPPLQKTNVKLVTWTKEPIEVKGLANVCVKLGNKEAQCELIVVSGHGPNLLGRNWFQPLQLEVIGLCWSDDDVKPYKEEFAEIFQEDLGQYTGPEVSLHVHADVKPQFMRARSVPFPLKKQVEEELQKMVDTGVLTPVRYSEWATPITIVKKPDGSLRLCGDYRSTVNAAIETESYPLPTSNEAFVKLSGGRIFTKLDLKQAYTQMKVDEETAKLLTWNTHIGLMKVNRLAFGVSAAPAIFQRVMSSALAGMEGVACLLDDIAITGATKEEHDGRLRQVLKKLQELGLRLNIKKCVFAANSITFLGHMIDADGLHPSPAKVKEILEKPAPTNRETLRAFLGLYNFYEKFLPDKSTVLEPLYRLLELKRPWTWGDKEHTAFNEAKRLLSSDLTLVGYDLNKEILLICDSSEYGLGAIIAHIMEDGSERPIMMSSRTLQAHERRYGQIDKEALAIMFGLSKFHEFLMGRKFCIVTDHKPLIGLFNPAKPIPEQVSPRMLRWSLKLACYDYSIKYRAGKDIGNADALSRWTIPATATKDEEILREVLLLEEQPGNWQLDARKIAEETKKDPLLQKVIFHVLHGWPRKNSDPALQVFWNKREALSHNKDCLLWSNRVVIPSTLQGRVLKLLHEPHAGMVQTKAYARGYVWWVDMDKEIEHVVAECEQCQSVRNNPPKDPQSWIVAEKPWSRVHIDFAGPFQGKTFLVLIDSHSKWLEAEMINSMNSSTVITILRKIFIAQGLPDTVVSDNGRTFSSEEFNTFLEKNGIKHLYSPPYHPQTNGQIERAIQTFKNKIKKMLNVNLSWHERLCKVLYYLRTVPGSTNKSPAEMLNRRRFRTAVSVLHPDSAPSRSEVQLENAAQTPRNRKFAVNQSVLVRSYGPEKWKRAVVEVVEGPASYLVRMEDGGLQRRHIDQILARPNRVEPSEHPRESGAEESSEDDLTPIIIPPPELWPDMIGIPNTD